MREYICDLVQMRKKDRWRRVRRDVREGANEIEMGMVFVVSMIQSMNFRFWKRVSCIYIK